MTWNIKKLGHVLRVQNGYAFDSKNFSDYGTPLIRIRDIREGVTTEISYNGEYDGKYLVHSGDFLIGMDGEFGCYEWKGSVALLNQRVCRLEHFTGLDPRFLFYGINKHLKDIEDHTTFTTVKHISSKQIENIDFSFPESLIEQRRIVTLLDGVFGGIAKAKENAEKNLKNSRELFESYLQRIFSVGHDGWMARAIGELCDIQNGYAFKSKDYVHDGFRVIRIGNVQNGRIIDKLPKFLPTSFSKEYGEYELHEGDILISLTGDVGRVGKIASDLLPAMLNQRVGRICRISKDIDPFFLYVYLNSESFERLVIASAFGAAQKNTSTNKIKELNIQLPPSIDEQRYIASRVEELSKQIKQLEKIYQKKIAALEELKRSVLKKAFAGEL
jgi:type I restriction enzyme S subunit